MLFNIHKFKKISSDKTNTVLEHPDGHTITINHSALGPKMRKQLMALEAHKKAPAMADGGSTGNSPQCTDKKTGTLHPCTPDDYVARSNKTGWSPNQSTDKSKEGGDPSANPDTGSLLHGMGFAKGGQVRAMDNGGQSTIPGGNGSPSIDPQKAKEMQSGATQPGTTMSEGWQNLKSAVGMAKGGPVRAMADGTQADDMPNNAPLEVEPVNAQDDQAAPSDPNDSGDTSTETAPPGTPQVGGAAPAPQAAAPVDPADQGPQQPQAQDPTAAAGANPQDPAAAAPIAPMTPQEIQAGHRQGMLNEDQAWANDLKNGHITPETMGSLFAKRDTLGKVRSIFGILLSGIGSGLTHQPNAALAMMQKQIDNDVSAQVNSKSNAHNAYQLHLQNELQKAQIPQLVAQGKLTTAQAEVAKQDAAQKAYALTRMTANRSALHDAMTANAALPEGSPQRKAGDQAIGLMFNSVNNENFNIADRAAAAQTLAGMSGGGNNAAAMSAYGGPEAKAMVDFTQQHSIPGVEGQSTQPINEGDRAQVNAMNILDNKGKDVLNFIQQNKGTLSPNQRSIAAQKVEEMKNFYNESIKGGAMTEGRLGWYDKQFGGNANPTSILGSFMGNTAKLKEMVDSNATRRDEILHDKLGFPQYKQSGGSKYQKVPGGWKKVQ